MYIIDYLRLSVLDLFLNQLREKSAETSLLLDTLGCQSIKEKSSQINLCSKHNGNTNTELQLCFIQYVFSVRCKVFFLLLNWM